MINEVLTKSTPASEWIKDFVDSDNPKFAGKSAAKRKQMALAAYYAKKNESVEEAAAVSQNSIAVQDMEAVEYKGIGTDVVDKKKKLNPQPNLTMAKKQVKDFKEEVELIDEISKQTADSYLSKVTKDHVGKHGMQPNMFDKLPKNRQQGVSNALKRLISPERPSRPGDIHGKSFTEEKDNREYGYEGDMAMSQLKTIIRHSEHLMGMLKPDTDLPEWVQSKITLATDYMQTAHDYLMSEINEEVKKSTGDLKKACWKGYTAVGLKMKDGRKVPNCVPEETELEEAKVYDPFTKKMVNTKPIKVQAGGGTTRNGVPVETGPSKYKSKLPMSKAAGVLAAEEVELIAKHEVKANAPHKSGGHVILTKSSNKWHVLHNKKSSPEAKDLHRSKLLHSYADEKEARAKFKELHEEQIDELSKGLVARYANKVAKTTQANYDKSKDKFQFSSDRQDGMKNAVKRLTKEEAEQIDEVSKSTLMRYIPKASRDVGSHTYAGKEAGEWANHYTRAGDWSAAEKHSKKSYADFKKANKRIKGIDTATKKLGTQKEEVELDEAIAKKLPVQHAVDAVHATLGPKSATRFLSHLTPGSDKHTSWDKVNDALVKQGVQTHHIASIAQKTSRMNEEVIDESRGHKVLATFFKNREVAQRSYQGNPAKDAEVAQGGGSPADQGIAAAKADYKKMNKENVNPALMAILKKRQEAQKKKQEDKKKVNEATAPAVHAAEPKKTKSTPKKYASATIPGTKRVAHAKPDDNEAGGGTATRIAEDQYTSEYKIKSYVDPVTGENKTRKIRPHRINFKSSKMNAAPAQMTEPVKVNEGHDDYSSIAKELVKRHGKNVTAQHVKDFAGERDTHRGLDHAEVMHHVKKLSEDDKVYDEKWKKVKFTDFIKGAK